MTIRSIEDLELLSNYLTRDRIGCAYHLGYLDPSVADWCRWWGAFDADDALQLLLLQFSGTNTPVILTIGDVAYLDELLVSLHGQIPEHFYCLIEEDHPKGFESRYELDGLRKSTRLALAKDDYEVMPEDPFVVRLRQKDTTHIEALVGAHSDVFFEPYQLETGYTFGFFEQAGGQLVSFSGIHLFNHEKAVAILGNVLTMEKYRRMGLAFRVLGRQLNELFERVDLVAINVPADNEEALELYDCHNLEKHQTYWEGAIRLAF